MEKQENREWVNWLKAFIVALLSVWFVRTFIVIPIEVDGISMYPTLEDQDYLIVEKLSYQFGSPKRFDIVVFHATEEKDYIKRIIGLPGEKVEYRENQLYVNGEIVEETFLNTDMDSSKERYLTTDDFDLYVDVPGHYRTIPKGYYLVLGDNRQDSTDSRMIGLINEKDIMGKARFIYWPFNRMGSIY